eukprot:scaffold4975_cov112-Isochrysis_galbana.AAC.3
MFRRVQGAGSSGPCTLRRTLRRTCAGLITTLMVKCAKTLFASKSRMCNPKFCPFIFFCTHPPRESAGPCAARGPAQDPAEHPSYRL